MTRVADSKEIDLIFNSLPDDEFNMAYDLVEANGRALFKKYGPNYELVKRNDWPMQRDLVEVRRWWTPRR